VPCTSTTGVFIGPSFLPARVDLVPLDRQQVRHMVGELAARQALAKEVIQAQLWHHLNQL